MCKSVVIVVVSVHIYCGESVSTIVSYPTTRKIKDKENWFQPRFGIINFPKKVPKKEIESKWEETRLLNSVTFTTIKNSKAGKFWGTRPTIPKAIILTKTPQIITIERLQNGKVCIYYIHT